MRDLGVDLSARMGVCMYRTISHLPPETLLRNEITKARPRAWTLLSPGHEQQPAIAAQ